MAFNTSSKSECHLDCETCFIRELSIFNSLRPEDILFLNQHKTHLLFKKGKSIFNIGQRPMGVYMVFSGKVKIQMLGANAKEQIVRLAKAGDVIGYRSMIRGENYNASAEALEETTVCFLSKETFFELLSNNFPVSMNLMKLLSENLGDAETKMVGLLQKPTKNRIAETILVLKELYGTEADSQTLNIVMTREEIANYAGMSTETAIRILYDLRGDGVIALEKKKIKILNFQKLIQISGAND